MGPSSFAAAGDHLLVHLNSSFSTACPGHPQATPTSSNISAEKCKRLVKDFASEKKEVVQNKKKQRNLSSMHSRIWGNFQIWRMNFRSGVSSDAGRPMEAMFWIGETQSAKSTAERKTSSSITGANLQTDSFFIGRQVAWMICECFQGQRHGRISPGPQ